MEVVVRFLKNRDLVPEVGLLPAMRYRWNGLWELCRDDFGNLMYHSLETKGDWTAKCSEETEAVMRNLEQVGSWILARTLELMMNQAFPDPLAESQNQENQGIDV
jgi:hypothetical protein